MLGTSAAAPDPDRGGSGILLTVLGRHYLVDCGANTTRSMIKSHINPTEVNTVFLSHLHYDHIVDFPYFLLTSWICDRKEPPVVVGPEGTFPESAIEFRKKAKVGTWSHTYPKARGEIARKANAKRLVATHFGSYDTCNPVVREIMGAHMPNDMIGPALLDEVAADIKKTCTGELWLAHDNMRIDI